MESLVPGSMTAANTSSFFDTVDCAKDIDEANVVILIWNVLVGVVGLPGNTLILLVHGSKLSTNRMTSPQLIIFYLAFADLFGCLNLPLRYHRYYNAALPDAWFKIGVCTSTFANVQQLILLVLAAVERYRAMHKVNRPIRQAQNTCINKVKKSGMLIFCVLASAFLSIITLLFMNKSQRRHLLCDDNIGTLKKMYGFITFGLIGVIVTMYVKIALILRRRMRPEPSGTPTTPPLTENVRRNDHFTSLFQVKDGFGNTTSSIEHDKWCVPLPTVSVNMGVNEDQAGLDIQNKVDRNRLQLDGTVPVNLPTTIKRRGPRSAGICCPEHDQSDAVIVSEPVVTYVDVHEQVAQLSSVNHQCMVPESRDIPDVKETTGSAGTCCQEHLQSDAVIVSDDESREISNVMDQTKNGSLDSQDFVSIQLHFPEEAFDIQSDNEIDNKQLAPNNRDVTCALSSPKTKSYEPMSSINGNWHQLPGAVIDEHDLQVPDASPLPKRPKNIHVQENNPWVVPQNFEDDDIAAPKIPTLEDRAQKHNDGGRLFRKTTIMLVVVSALCILTEAPRPVAFIFWPRYRWVFREISLINFAVNPFVYGIVNKCFRKDCMTLFRRIQTLARNRIGH